MYPTLTSGRERTTLTQSGRKIWETDIVMFPIFIVFAPLAMALGHHWLLSPHTSAAAHPCIWSKQPAAVGRYVLIAANWRSILMMNHEKQWQDKHNTNRSIHIVNFFFLLSWGLDFYYTDSIRWEADWKSLACIFARVSLQLSDMEEVCVLWWKLLILNFSYVETEGRDSISYGKRERLSLCQTFVDISLLNW